MGFDPAFIQEVEHRPKPTIIEADGIPVIDLSPVSSLDSLANVGIHIADDEGGDIARLVAEIGDACSKWGFFQVINHGVPSESVDRLESLSREFFSLPLEEKKKVRRDEGNPMGYYESEHTKNVRDWKEVFDCSVRDATLCPLSLDDPIPRHLINTWPENPPQLREACLEYGREAEKLAYKLLELISLSLGVAADRLESFFKDGITFIRLNHYPPCPSPDLALGVGRHKDSGALTILFQDEVGGLQVRRKSDGEWISVKPTPNAFIINVGDIIQVWSNDKYESVEHRVMVNSIKDRLSIPLFFNPAHYVVVEPLPELLHDRNPAKYRGYNFGNFFAARKGSNFKKLAVENLQISHFRVQVDQET
ncbi:hypothetical protein Dimus_002261 [Dionaea muscipula]